MFHIDDLIIYGTSGVCVVADICPSPFDKTDARTYYKLCPADTTAGGVIYTPVENDKIPMRHLLSREQGEALLSSVASSPFLDIPVEKQRKDIYKQALLSTEPVRWLGIMRSVRRRGIALLAQRKNLPDLDREFSDRAQKYLTSELSIVLDRPREEIAEIILANI
jgi:CarD family transcriptional regulator